MENFCLVDSIHDFLIYIIMIEDITLLKLDYLN